MTRLLISKPVIYFITSRVHINELWIKPGLSGFLCKVKRSFYKCNLVTQQMEEYLLIIMCKKIQVVLVPVFACCAFFHSEIRSTLSGSRREVSMCLPDCLAKSFFLVYVFIMKSRLTFSPSTCVSYLDCPALKAMFPFC